MLGADKVSLLGLKDLQPGKPLTARVKSAKDNKTFDVVLNHTLNKGQIEWFYAGSALNLIAK